MDKKPQNTGHKHNENLSTLNGPFWIQDFKRRSNHLRYINIFYALEKQNKTRHQQEGL